MEGNNASAYAHSLRHPGTGTSNRGPSSWASWARRWWLTGTGQAAGAGHHSQGRTRSALARLFDLQGCTHFIPTGSVAQGPTVYVCAAVTGIF